MKEVIDFFRRLHDDNTREWFDAHRAEWTRVKGRFADFTGQLIGGIASFDPEVRGLRPQDCTYRIARDTRFSPDKSPYKTYIGAYIAPKGKKSGFAGYYFHIEPCCDSLVCCNLLSAGRPRRGRRGSPPCAVCFPGAASAVFIWMAPSWGVRNPSHIIPGRFMTAGFFTGYRKGCYSLMRAFRMRRGIVKPG